VIRYHLAHLIENHEFKTQQRWPLVRIAEETGIHRVTLSKLGNPSGYVTTTDTLDRLCSFFGCSLSELATHMPNPKQTNRKSPKG
jgi:putative transcriptional regulator